MEKNRPLKVSTRPLFMNAPIKQAIAQTPTIAAEIPTVTIKSIETVSEGVAVEVFE